MNETFRIDRRTTIKWVLAATAALPAVSRLALGEPEASESGHSIASGGYGTDPVLTLNYAPGDVWPLSLTEAERRTAAALCDLILPADEHSPGASAVGVVDFLDEWISAPYPVQQADRQTVLAGFKWLDGESNRRFGSGFADLDESQLTGICDAICDRSRVSAEREPAAKFFARYRDLTVGGFYTTPEGIRDLGYVGNVALARFDGPPPEVLRQVGLNEPPA